MTMELKKKLYFLNIFIRTNEQKPVQSCLECAKTLCTASI